MDPKTVRTSQKAGLPPGTLVHVGEKRSEMVRISVMHFDADTFEEKELTSPEECANYLKSPRVTWINVDGLHDVEVIEKLGTYYDLHPLLMEDILHTIQRPKAEDFEKHIFMVVKMLCLGGDEGRIDSEQVSMVLGADYVLTFQEKRGDVFDPIRNRLRSGKGRIRKMGADYLAYALIDAIVDSYFSVLESLGERVEELEEAVVGTPEREVLMRVYALKRDLISLRRSVWPLRELISSIERSESTLVKAGTLLYLRDVYDHTIQVMDTIEANREVVAGMVEVYLSSLSNRMNDVMKVLTIIATIFIPLTFIAGVYGMNFAYMPELEWPPAYFAVLALMAAIAVVMLALFKKRRWL